MAESFGDYLRWALERKGMTLRAYALAIGLGKSHSFAYRVAKGAVAPPLKDLGRWAAPLDLTVSERRYFELLAAVANSPLQVQKWFALHNKNRRVSGTTRRGVAPRRVRPRSQFGK